MQRGVGRRLYAALEHAIGFGPAYTFLVLFLDRVSALDECRDFWNAGADTDVSEWSELTVWAFWQNLFSVTWSLIPN
jgi:hypothetical protein